MTKSQSETLNSMVVNYARYSTKVILLGEDGKGKIMGELDAPAYTQKFTIGKKGAVALKYKYNRI